MLGHLRLADEHVRLFDSKACTLIFGRATRTTVTQNGLGFRVLGFKFRVSGFEFRVSGLGFRVSGFGFRVSGFKVRMSGYL